MYVLSAQPMYDDGTIGSAEELVGVTDPCTDQRVPAFIERFTRMIGTTAPGKRDEDAHVVCDAIDITLSVDRQAVEPGRLLEAAA